MRLQKHFICPFLLVWASLSPLVAEELYSPRAEIYVPGPQFKDLNRPVTGIRDLPVLPQVYRGLGVAPPQPYSHYRYLYYGAFNYRMQSYPYQAFQGGGQRNPGYFAWNRNFKDPTSKKANRKLGKVQIITVASRLSEEMEGGISAKKLIPFWVQAVGFKRPPPVVSRRHRAAFLNTPSDKTPRIIRSVKISKVKGQSRNIRVSYSSSPSESTRFYKNKDKDALAVLSLAIFEDLGAPVQFVELLKDDGQDKDSPPEAEFLASGRLSGLISNRSLYRPRSSSGAMNLSLQSLEDLSNVRKYLDLSDRDSETLEDVDFEKEIVYLTGRAFPSRATALDLSDRKILRVSDMGSRRIKHLVEVEEARKSRETVSLRDKGHDELYFSGFFVVIERPRTYGGYRFGVTVKD
jgi:hypothetical protein